MDAAALSVTSSISITSSNSTPLTAQGNRQADGLAVPCSASSERLHAPCHCHNRRAFDRVAPFPSRFSIFPKNTPALFVLTIFLSSIFFPLALLPIIHYKNSRPILRPGAITFYFACFPGQFSQALYGLPVAGLIGGSPAAPEGAGLVATDTGAAAGAEAFAVA